MRLLILFFMLPAFLSAQKIADKFTLSPAGFEDSVIRDYPGKSDSDLFLATRRWASNMISNPKDAISREVENQYLEYKVFVPQAISIKDNGQVYTWDAMFDLAFRYKDGSIRYDVEIVELSSPEAPTFQIVGGRDDWAFFALNNEPYPLTTDARMVLEETVNDWIRGVSAYVNRGAEIPEED
ncbi:hypothetical protein [Christiangramia sabulilitoris]|uniref:DUF4468 domain-containing protein n=1 Tax=Christiangramia sabulilitoris TaxID=2583991 RepID=A0A550I6M6_9FLAO|nr:hypothetical protein [Christiangramia sabulilitoris]TRO66622.1 hypothetical protein FGM01_01695 [Christiangramia sabulilitoris]